MLCFRFIFALWTIPKYIQTTSSVKHSKYMYIRCYQTILMKDMYVVVFVFYKTNIIII